MKSEVERCLSAGNEVTWFARGKKVARLGCADQGKCPAAGIGRTSHVNSTN